MPSFNYIASSENALQTLKWLIAFFGQCKAIDRALQHFITSYQHLPLDIKIYTITTHYPELLPKLNTILLLK